MKSSHLDHTFGELRWRIYVFAALLLSAIGLFSYFTWVKGREDLLGGTLFILSIGALILFTLQGVEINPKEKKYRYYLRVFFLKLGMWKSYASFTDLILLRHKASNARPMNSGKEVLGSGKVVYEIYLAHPNHFTMVLIKKTPTQADGEHDADELARQLGVEWVQYNPGRRKPRKILGGKA